MTVTACFLMAAAAFDLRVQAPIEMLGSGAIWAALGVIAFGAAMWLSRRRLVEIVAPTTAALTGTRIGWRWLIPGVLLLAVVSEMSGQILGITPLYDVDVTVQFLLFSASLVLLARGLGGAFPRLRLHGWKQALPIIGVLGLALAVRLIWLETSVHTLIDEAQDLSGMQLLWAYPNYGLLRAASGFLPTTMVYSYWEIVAVNLFGRSLLALRLTNAVVGTVNVLTLYWLAKALFDRRTALIAAFMLATFPPHIHFSRIASAHAGSCLGTLALAFAVRGLRENRRLDWALCGVALGLTQYFYEASRLLFPPLMLIWIGLMIVLDRHHLRTQWRGIVTAVVAALIVAAPVYYVIVAENSPVTSRMDDVGLSRDYWGNLFRDGISPEERDTLIQQFTMPLIMIVHQPELATYYGGNQPLILDIFLPVVLLGVAFALWKAQTPAIIVLLWVLAAVAGNSLLTDNTQYPRYVVMFPALALLSALGIRATVSLLIGLLDRHRQAALVIPLVAVIGLFRLNYYFFEHLPVYNAQVRNEQPHPDGTDAIFRGLALPQPNQIVLISDPAIDRNIPNALWSYLTNPPLNPPPDNLPIELTPAEVTDDWLASLPRDRRYVFFVAPDDQVTVAALGRAFTLVGPELTTHEEIPPDKRFTLYTTEPQETN